MRVLAVSALSAALVAACGGASERAQVRAEANPNMPDRVQPPAPSPRTRDPVTTCPEALAGAESIDRRIGKACGTVRVQPGYRLDGGTLTIEGGVTLAFEPGADLAIGYEREAALEVLGSAAEPVVFTSAGEKAPGAWKGVMLYDHADHSKLEGLVIEYSGSDTRGAIQVQAEDVHMRGVTVRDSKGVAVHVTPKGQLAVLAGTKLERVSSPALLIPASSVGAIAQDNSFPEGSVVHVLAGRIRERVRWHDLGIPYVIGGRLEVEGEDDTREALLELAPGVELRFDEDAYVNVGYDHPAAIRADAEGEEPIVFTSANAREPRAWRSVNLYSHATAHFTNVVFEYGGQRSDRGVVYVNGEARLHVRGCTFKDSGGGVTLESSKLQIEAFSGNRFQNAHPALDASPQAFGQIAADNELDAETTILLEGGTIEKDAVWRDFGVPIEVVAPISIDSKSRATLTVEPGVRMRVRDGFGLGVGELYGGTLKMTGTAERPIVLAGLNDRRGTWDAIRLYSGASGNLFEHVSLRNAGGDAAITVSSGAEAVVRDVGCARCFSPTLTWACGARVTAERVVASESTAAATAPPANCEAAPAAPTGAGR